MRYRCTAESRRGERDWLRSVIRLEVRTRPLHSWDSVSVEKDKKNADLTKTSTLASDTIGCLLVSIMDYRGLCKENADLTQNPATNVLADVKKTSDST